jgi:hypothetical protein
MIVGKRLVEHSRFCNCRPNCNRIFPLKRRGEKVRCVCVTH